MKEKFIQVQKWRGAQPPDESELRRLMAAEGLQPQRWSNGPHETYNAHTHDFHKVIYVVSGSILFGFPIVGEPTELHPGDRLDLPAGVLHNAAVGRSGVVCLEAHV